MKIRVKKISKKRYVIKTTISIFIFYIFCLILHNLSTFLEDISKLYYGQKYLTMKKK